MKELFALVDCNSFYCSCERLFLPQLRKSPVIVLSNNDGCAVSRSNEAKALGIKMGAPYFKIKNVVKNHQVAVFSSNYTFYGDMSNRVMQTLSEFTPELEVYSIDEAFLSLRDFHHKNLNEYALEIKNTVFKNTGIPVSVGIGPTKVLAKMANKIAKKTMADGVFDLSDPKAHHQVLKSFPVGDIWGIGRQSTKKLRSYGIETAQELRDANEKMIQKLLTIVGKRILNELRGISCLSLELIEAEQKQIICSRGFGKPVYDLGLLQEALANYVTRAAVKLRRKQLVCQTLHVFIQTNRFKNTLQYYNSITIQLPSGTSATNHLIAAALRGLKSIYRKGFEYKKTGVILSRLTKKSENQLGLFKKQTIFKDEKLMKTIDQINNRMGAETIKFASCGTEHYWKMLSEHKSPCYTTRWKDLLCVGSTLGR